MRPIAILSLGRRRASRPSPARSAPSSRRRTPSRRRRRCRRRSRRRFGLAHAWTLSSAVRSASAASESCVRRARHAPFGDDRGDVAGRRHVERWDGRRWTPAGAMALAAELDHLIDRALLDRDARRRSTARGRASRSARRRRTGCRSRLRARPACRFRSCWRRRRCAAMRSAPTMTRSTRPATHEVAGHVVGDQRHAAIASLLELPGGQPGALQERSRLVDVDVMAACPARRRRGPRPARCRSRRWRAPRRCSGSGRSRRRAPAPRRSRRFAG